MQTIRKSLGLVLIMFVLCGFIFPLTVTALGQVLFPEQANGSLVKQDGKVIGSKLIGQQWTEPKYFHGRISAVNYNMNANEVKESGGPASGGSNYGNSNPELKKEFKRLLNKKEKKISSDAVTASGSGLDPDITVDNAKQQVKRIAKERNIDASKLITLLMKTNKHHQWQMIMLMS